ncbi:sulfotransferase [Acidithiobacillus sp. IBUN Pt1247-S3]|uniref:sulfotransferase family protein n=1 Tax=Acidithiobacillus sp. IBUN Pt1247-S3 TaxID=3166642 RepID=UPI0034E3DBA3
MNNASKPIWPNFFITGTVKGGTTSLYRHLQKHPDVFLPAFKEPHYFARIQPKNRHLIEHITDENTYLNLYRNSRTFTAVGDASTSNLWCRKAPERIHAVAPHARIIILLRDPISRAHSHYLMEFREGLVNQSFSVDLLHNDFSQSRKGLGISHMYVDLGLYYEQVRRYLQIFGKDQVLILQFDDLVQEPSLTLKKVAAHLHIDPKPFQELDLSEIHNGFKAPRNNWARRCAASPAARWIGYHLIPRNLQWWLYQNMILKSAAKPQVEPNVRQYLQDIYTPDIEKLEALLEHKMPTLRSSW